MNSHHSFHIRFLHLPILTYERKFTNLPRSMQFACCSNIVPTLVLDGVLWECSSLPILLRECFRTFLHRHGNTSVVIAQSTVPHISVGRLFNFQGSRKFNLPYIPRHRKSQIFQKNKKFLKIFSFGKKDKKIRPSRMHSRKSCCYIFSYTFVRLSISLCTFSSITFFFLEIAL